MRGRRPLGIDVVQEVLDLTTNSGSAKNNSLGEGEVRQRLNFLGFTEADANLLSSIRPWVESVAKEFATKFYDKSFADAGFSEVVRRNNSNRGTLEGAQAAYAIDLFRGWPSSGYVELRQRIGSLHARIGVTPQYYVSSYQFYYDILVPMIRKHMGMKRGKANEIVASMNKLLLFDQAVIMDTYIDGIMDQLRVLAQQVEGTANGVAEASKQLSSAAEQAGQATQGITDVSQQVARGTGEQSENAQRTIESMQQLSNAINQIATGSQEQAVSVEQATGIATQMSNAINDVARNSQSASQGSNEANDAAKNGSDIVGKTVEGMGRISSAMEVASDQISQLGTQSEEIGKIVAVIDDIAAQTNLLALNAAIEAARAGEQGRGFAVVADEVRGLAERVTEATKEIASLIDSIQKGVAESIKAAEDGTREVGVGVKLAEEAGTALTTILESVEGVAGQIEQISAAAEEVSASSDEMVTTMDTLSNVTEQNSAAAEQMSANSTEVTKAIDSIAAISEETSASTEEMSASAEQMSAQVQEVVASTQTLDGMAQELQETVKSLSKD